MQRVYAILGIRQFLFPKHLLVLIERGCLRTATTASSMFNFSASLLPTRATHLAAPWYGRFLVSCLLAPLLFLSVAFSGAVTQASPNIVLIISDDQAWTDYGFMGHPVIRTPHLDRLASQSLVFPRGYVPSSVCRPSLASIISGLYPHQHLITGNDPAGVIRAGGDDPDYVRKNEIIIRHIDRVATLPRLLAPAGYLSFQSGKWWEGHYSRGGFTHGMTHGHPPRSRRLGDEGLKIGREGLEPIFEFIESAGERPFFVWYAPFMPHGPHNPPERHVRAYRGRGLPEELVLYYGMCSWFDETVGDLLAYLDRHGLSENTLVAYVTDNGWIQRTPSSIVPSGWRSWRFPLLPASKLSPNEGGVRTPILLRWPGRIEPREMDNPVSSIDLAPTILLAAGLEPPREMPGIDLLSPSAVTGRPAVFGGDWDHDLVNSEDPVLNLEHRWCVSGQWKLIVPHASNVSDPRLQLYDVVNDPNETHNRSFDHPELVRELMARIQDWWAVE